MLSLLSLNFGQIQPLTTSLAVLKRLKHKYIHIFLIAFDSINFKMGVTRACIIS